MQLRPLPVGWGLPLLCFGYAALGFSLRLRGGASLEARAGAAALVGASFLLLMFHGSFSEASVIAWLVVDGIAFAVTPPLALRFVFVTPAEKFGAREPPLWIWAFAAMGVSFPSWLLGWPLPVSIGAPLHNTLAGSAALIGFAVFAQSYRSADALGRRKLRWVLYGVVVAALIWVEQALANALLAGLWFDRLQLTWVGLLATPLCIFIAITRYDAFDVDRWISATLTYGVVAAGLVLGLALAVPWLAEALRSSVGVPERAAQALAAAALVGLAVPGQRVVRQGVDRLLFPTRHELEQGVTALLGELAAAQEPAERLERACVEIDRLFRPASIALHARDSEVFAPLFLRGREPLPDFPAADALASALAARHAPLRRSPQPFDRAVLDTLGAELVVPIQGSRGLLAFLSLGARRSGDVWTPGDASLLAAIAQALSAALARFEASESRRETQRMRSYVPGAVAGREPEAGEQEVTILFVA